MITNAHGNAGTSGSRATFTASSAITYRIALDGFAGSQGPSVLSWIQPSAPVITQQPAATNVIAGNNVTFTAMAIGVPTPGYQWRFNGSTIGGATNNTYTITGVTAGHAATYSVDAINSVGAVTSAGALLTVYPSATPQLLSGACSVSPDEFRFNLIGVPGYQHVVRSTANFTNWTALKTNTSPFWFTNLVTTNSPRLFFRSVYFP